MEDNIRTSTLKQKKYAIIVAGGTGSRMESDLPKQFLLLGTQPVLMHTIRQFSRTASAPEIIVVLHPDMCEYWAERCKTYQFHIPHQVVIGGQSRFQSVKNGLETVFAKEKGDLKDMVIAIHDAARPVIDPALIDQCFTATATCGATILAVSSINSIRVGTTDSSKAKDRAEVWIVQTPQTFTGNILAEAFQQEESAQFTDDASVVEKLGYPIHILVGDYKNIKITFPEDLQIAQLYLNAQGLSSTSYNT